MIAMSPRQRVLATERASVAELVVEVPSSPPELGPGAAKALARLLLKAHRARTVEAVPGQGEPDALAS